jgi:putative endonuclease
MTTLDVGAETEQIALNYLINQKLKLLTRNFRCKVGELDLIMLSAKHELIFVEVCYRKSKEHGGALESITVGKQRKLIKTAQYFLLKHSKYANHPCRFDVIAIHGALNKPEIEWLQDAIHG